MPVTLYTALPGAMLYPPPVVPLPQCHLLKNFIACPQEVDPPAAKKGAALSTEGGHRGSAAPCVPPAPCSLGAQAANVAVVQEFVFPCLCPLLLRGLFLPQVLLLGRACASRTSGILRSPQQTLSCPAHGCLRPHSSLSRSLLIVPIPWLASGLINLGSLPPLADSCPAIDKILSPGTHG